MHLTPGSTTSGVCESLLVILGGAPAEVMIQRNWAHFTFGGFREWNAVSQEMDRSYRHLSSADADGNDEEDGNGTRCEDEGRSRRQIVTSSRVKAHLREWADYESAMVGDLNHFLQEKTPSRLDLIGRILKLPTRRMHLPANNLRRGIRLGASSTLGFEIQRQTAGRLEHLMEDMKTIGNLFLK